MKSEQGKMHYAFGTSIICMILLCFLSFSTAFAFWGQSDAASLDGDSLISIGDWIPYDPDTNRFNEFVTRLLSADPLLRKQADSPTPEPYYTLYILGSEILINAPSMPPWFTRLKIGDVLVWQRNDGSSAAAQVVGNISEDVLLSWSTLEAVLRTSNTNLTGYSNRIYNSHYTYTTAHAPICRSGGNYLARNSSVNSTPNDDNLDDWFKISETWIYQYYPVGSFAEYNGSHYIKISDGDASSFGVYSEPDDTNYWKEIEKYSEDTFIPEWSDGVWLYDDIVAYSGEYYVSVANNNSDIPGDGGSWARVPLYTGGGNVPFWTGKSYAIGSFVNYGESYYIRTTNGNDSALPSEDNSPWTRVVSWDEAAGVAKYQPGNSYPGRYAGQYVEYEDNIYEHLGRNANKNTSITNSSYWQRVEKWSEVDPSNPPAVVATKVSGFYVIWTLNTDKEFVNEANEPTDASDEWIRVPISCNDTYVYSEYDGRIVLWQIRDGISETFEAPGTGSDWVKLNYTTGANYVYSVDSTGTVSVWHSQSQSGDPPGLASADWRLLNSTGSLTEGEYYYFTAEKTGYYKAVKTESGAIILNCLESAWIGGGNEMIYMWNSNNIYKSGDIVVFGITGTNTYIYYRVKDNIGEVCGIEPAAASGGLYWEPINSYAE